MSLARVARRLAEAGSVFADQEASVLVEAAGSAEQLDAMVARREAGVPLEYVTGWTEFRGLRLAVEAGVFVTREGSGLLVDEAASLVRCVSARRRPVVVDLCCGIGAIGAALAAELPQVKLHAADIDQQAVACAELNLAACGGAVHQGDLFAALPRRLRRRIDVLVAIPPYVPTGMLPFLAAEAREHEATIALDGGADGLDVARRIARGARHWLAVDGYLAVELSARQLEPAELLLHDLGYRTRTVESEAHGAAVIVGRHRH